MSTKYEAHYEDRTFYFFITSKEPDEIRITMYGAVYTLVKKDDEWKNHSTNQMIMVPGLVNAVVAAAGL
ncbi:hypothetical protein D0C36_00345 [Mucilaginibacter conchicola]|uniref:Uncharacterized protein n=1 Tax=Mucilaginibacter conchicola TaxID=2303333 RepID=A0A372NWY2_9SPHI|nr:hypothetical protein [Mucilaginibacter conchicola]RFZ94047.1 hypothetical protein D0C36_00345 [Mucilaginibacter conchicola]